MADRLRRDEGTGSEGRLEEAEVELQEERWEKERKLAAWAQLEERFAAATAARTPPPSRR